MTDFHQQLILTNLGQGANEYKVHEIRFISFLASRLAIKCLLYKDRHTDTFHKLSNHVQESETCKSIKTASLNFLRKSYFHFISVEEI